MSESDSKFGFKDKAKALETLELLESHELQYRKLTVRGLLGRAKRVLAMTKAADKLKNINEAIEVFEHWLSEHGGGAAQQNAKTDSEDKVESVPGLGFKDKAAAEATLNILKERDPEYQKLAVKGLIGSSKRVLSGTKNPDKIKAIKEGVQVLEDFLEQFDKDNLIKNNRAYLAYAIIEKLPAPTDDSLAKEFLAAYGGSKAKGNYKHLRTMYPQDDEKTSWDILRNRNIAKILEQIKESDAKLYDESTGAPTELHLKLIHWAYTPQPDKLKSYVTEQQKEPHETPKKKAAKRKSSKSSNQSKSSDSGDDDDDVTPKKKHKKSH